MQVSTIDKFTYFLASTEDKINLLEDISFLLKQDMPLVDIAIDLQKGSGFEKVIGDNMQVAIDQSISLDHVFTPLLSKTTLQTLKSGINSGDVVRGFDDAKKALELNEGQLLKLIKAYLIPTLKLLALAMGLGFFGDFIFSQLVESLPPQKWGFLSQSVYSVTGGIVESWLTILTLCAVSFVAVWFTCSQVTGPFRKYLDYLPFYKQYRILNAATTLSNLSVLLNADMALRKSVRFLHDSSNKYSQYHLSRIEKNIQNSRTVLGKTLDTGMINNRDIHRLSRQIPENEIGDRLQMAADSHNTILQRQVDRLAVITKNSFLFMCMASVASLFGAVFLVVLDIR